VQRCIWVTEEGDHCDIEVLRSIARRCGIDEDIVIEAVSDNRSDATDAGVKEWNTNHLEAVALGTLSCCVVAERLMSLGIFGTPNYVVNGEIFWGQDRLHMVDLRIRELLASGAKPQEYA